MVSYKNIVMMMMIPVLGACAVAAPERNQMTSEFELVYPSEAPPTRISTGSIMDNGGHLYPTRRIYQSGQVKVGDIITVLLDEAAQASRTSGLTAERETSNRQTPFLGGAAFFRTYQPGVQRSRPMVVAQRISPLCSPVLFLLRWLMS